MDLGVTAGQTVRAVGKVASHSYPPTVGLELGTWRVLQARSWAGLATADSIFPGMSSPDFSGAPPTLGILFSIE